MKKVQLEVYMLMLSMNWILSQYKLQFILKHLNNFMKFYFQSPRNQNKSKKIQRKRKQL